MSGTSEQTKSVAIKDEKSEATEESSSSLMKEGVLLKLGGQVKKFKRRYFRLEGGFLKYFKLKDKEPGKLLGMIATGTADIAVFAPAVYARENCFGITAFGKTRTYVFVASSEEERSEWVKLLEHCSSTYAPPSKNSMRQMKERRSKASAEGGLLGSSPSGACATEVADDFDDDLVLHRKVSQVNQVEKPDQHQYSDSDSEKEHEESDLSLDSADSEDENKKAHKDQTEKKEEDEEPVVKEGYLLKLGHQVKNWKRRFFRLRGFLLSYYLDDSSQESLGDVHTIGCLVKPEPDSLFNMKYVFSIKESNGLRRMYYVQGNGTDDLKAWFVAIHERHRYTLAPMPRCLYLKDHPTIAMNMNPTEEDLMEKKGHGLGTKNIATKVAKSKALKDLVSKKKRRFQIEGFNLDLTYITDRIIAMGFPSIGTEAVYRNSMPEVQRFFKERHDGHYKVYNLCSERTYDTSCFENRVLWFPFDDHNCPCFQDMSFFCNDVGKYLSEDPNNVVGIHCKAGKGRTGLLIAVFLLYCGEWKTADEALRYYAFARTSNQKGVTIPSQIRWVHYYEKYMKLSETGQGIPKPERLVLKKIMFSKSSPSFTYFTLACHGEDLSSKDHDIKEGKSSGAYELAVGEPFIALQDFQMTFWKVPTFGKTKRVFGFWLHTQFFDNRRVKLTKSEIDKVSKTDIPDFWMELFFEPSQDQDFSKHPPYLPQ